ncbi:MAG TPA: hypothetical protein VFO69_09765 [Allosphingosinicella sp.]|nr:hypothetical protein [Allosphingosinicella sp.]
MMRKTLMAAFLASSLSLGACATTNDDDLADIGTGAGAGAVVGAGAGAVIPGLSPIEGAVIGAGIGGLAGAIWADSDNDGRVDGYTRGGRYYEGTPPAYDPRTGRACTSTLTGAATGAAGGAVLGAGAGAVIGGVSPLEGAIAGALVGGVAGAVWADQNNDGCVDGYTRGNQYYQGAPEPVYQAPVRSGERG